MERSKPRAKKKPAKKAAAKKTAKKRPRRKKVDIPSSGVIEPVVLMPHQQDALTHFDAGERKQYHAWHRRAGKDWFGMYLGAREFELNPGTYWHLLPKHVQARRAIWHGIDHKTGRRFMDLFFGDLAAGVNNTDMFVEGENGSTWQLLGSDNYDRMVGANPRGVVFSEWALCDPRAWDYIRPILRANGGWAIFISTFRGRNHAWQMYQRLKDNPEWYVTTQTIDDTGIITPEQVEADRVSGMSDRLIDQEYYCKTVPPTGLGPYARSFAALQDVGGVHVLPETSRINSNRFIGVGGHQDYAAFVECSVRGQLVYIHGGNVARRHSISELLAKHQAEVANGSVTLAGPFELVANARLPFAAVKPAGTVETCNLLERATIDPTSIASAAMTAGLLPWLEEDEDEAQATQAVYRAVEHLAAIIGEGVWGATPSYTRHDSAVIAGGPKWQ